MSREIDLTVVVPTRNRRDAVVRLLGALTRQTVAASRFEVVVAIDGSTDGTTETLHSRLFPYVVHVLEGAARGPAAARNRGARRASGRILLFLDDDMEPDASTVAAHLLLHGRLDRKVGLGRMRPVTPGRAMFDTILRGWWDSMQAPIRRPGHRYSFKDLLSGHFSIRRSDFDALGGFDESFSVHEDYELAFRMLQHDMELRLVGGAVAQHHDDSTLEKALRRKFQEGRADVALARRHPALILGLPFAWRGDASRKKRALRRLAWSSPAAGDRLMSTLQRALPVYEAARLRFRWRAALGALLDYWYWRGIASALGRRAELQKLIAGAPPSQVPVTIDLAAGIPEAEAHLDRERPGAARLTLGDELVAIVPAYPGYERLRGAHLRPLLARWCAREYLQAAARRGVVPAWLPDIPA